MREIGLDLTRRMLPAAAAFLCASLLAACMPELGASTVTAVENSDRPATVDPGAAATMISKYRRASGLGPVTLDAKLNAIAAAHAKRMAASGRMAHILPGEGSFERRMLAGGYDAEAAAENIAAGQDNLDEVFAGWRKSRSHRANMLNRTVTRMGIAVAYSPKSKYKDFWCLILAKPDEKVGSAAAPR